jgi:hypothetical protein
MRAFLVRKTLGVTAVASLTLAVCLGAFPARATLVSIDDPVFGPGSITRDTATGLDWIDPALSANRSFSDVSMQLGASGDFAGFRYASASEVRMFFLNAGIPLVGNAADPLPGDDPRVAAFLALVGSTYSNAGKPGVIGITGVDSLQGGNEWVINPYGRGSLQGFVVVYQVGWVGSGVGEFVHDPSFGSWLVTATIPESGTALLFGAGVVWLAMMRRSRSPEPRRRRW